MLDVLREAVEDSQSKPAKKRSTHSEVVKRVVEQEERAEEEYIQIFAPDVFPDESSVKTLSSMVDEMVSVKQLFDEWADQVAG